MFSPFTLFIVICVYMALLFALATRVERHQARLSRQYVWVYGLAMGVLYTSWAFYGNVGDATTHGFRYMAFDFGTYACLALWWLLLWRMVQVKEALHITSIADFIAARYNRSQSIAGLVSLIALFGSVPYVGLQIKAVIESINVISSTPATGDDHLTGFATCIILLLFTILYGIRKLDPTEHHFGMLVVLALECVIKLLALIAIGLFVTFGLYQGFADIVLQAQANGLHQVLSFGVAEHGISSLIAQFVLGFFIVLALPRQFHIAVVENTDKRHIKPAAWILGGYILLFSIFIVPIAAAGLLQGLPAEQADMFILLLPLQADNVSLTLSTFLGGFAAASGMVIITTTAIATMVANHLVLPLAEHWRPISGLRAYLLQVRWSVALLVISLAYLFVEYFSAAFFFTALGSVALTALLQIMPALFGGLFWRRGNTRAALVSMISGLLVWCYTLLFPIMVREFGWFPQLLEYGPYAISWLKPEGLLGIDWLDNTAHGMTFSLGINTLLYVSLSMLCDPHKQERQLTQEFMHIFIPPAEGAPRQPAPQVRPTGLNDYIAADLKLEEASKLLNNYLRKDKAATVLQQIRQDLHVQNKSHINIIELVEFHRMLEHALAGSIGAASAHSAIQSHVQYSARESNELNTIYHHISSELNSKPPEDTSQHDRNKTIDLLQTRIATLERDIAAKQQEIDRLQRHLDSRYDDIHRLRMDVQRCQSTLHHPAPSATSYPPSDIEQENVQLKQMYAELSLEVQRLSALVKKKH